MCVNYLNFHHTANKTCTKTKSVEQCDKCLEGKQCKEGYCCPWMKKCMPHPNFRCSLPIANCIPHCFDDDTNCSCTNKCFPGNGHPTNKWAFPTCKD